jgi:hypothetical protein
MHLHSASRRGRESASAPAHVSVGAFLAFRSPGRRALQLVSLAASLGIVVAATAPATGATPDSALSASAGAAETLESSSSPAVVSPVDTTAQSLPTASLDAPDTNSAQLVPQEVSDVAPDASDIAQNGAVSPAVAHEEAFTSPADSAEPADESSLTPTGRAPTVSPDPASPAVSSSAPAPVVSTPVATAPSAPPSAQDHASPSSKAWQYRAPGKPQYRGTNSSPKAASELVAKVASNSPKIGGLIPRDTCSQNSCETVSNLRMDPPEEVGTADQLPLGSGLGAGIDWSDDPVLPGLIGQAGVELSCGNTNISFRLSSPGNEAGISQAAASGPCGRNTNISIRINSPGNNGPVTQSVGETPPPNPSVGIDPATFPAQVNGIAQRFAHSLVAQAQAKANRAVRQAPPPRAHPRSRSTARVKVYSAARASVAGGKVTASARVSIRTSLRTRHAPKKKPAAPGTKKRTADEAPPLPADRLTASPSPHVSKTGGGGSGFQGAAILLALLAALAGAYLLVPPLRPARAIGRSLQRWSKGGRPQ